MYYQKNCEEKALKKRLLCFLFAICSAVVLPLSLFGCGKNDKVIKINEVTHSIFYAPLYLADELGYFQEEGYSIELTTGGGADASMAALLSGSADIAFCGPEAALYVMAGGSSDSPVVFGQLTKRDGSFLVGRTEQNNFRWEDLAGKQILAGRRGGVPAMTFEYVLKQKSIRATLNYDVAFNVMTSAFESGVADYCTMFEPTASQYVAEGKGFIVASVGEASGEIPYTCFSARQSFIKNNPQKIDALLKGVTRAIKYINQTPSSTVAQKLAAYFDGTSQKALQTSIESYKKIDAWVTNMAMKQSAYERLLDVIDEAGELPKRIAFEELVQTKRANEIYREVYNDAGI